MNPATSSLSSLIVRVSASALTLDAQLIVSAFDVQTRDKPADLEGWGYVPRALRFEFLPPLAKGEDALASAHLLRIAGYAGAKHEGAPAAPLKPATPDAEPTDLLWMDADRVLRVLHVTGAAVSANRAPSGAWFFKAAVVGTDRVIAEPVDLARAPAALLHPDAESWRAVYG